MVYRRGPVRARRTKEGSRPLTAEFRVGFSFLGTTLKPVCMQPIKQPFGTN